MSTCSFGLAAIAASLLMPSASGQTSFPEVEPNSQKVEATTVTGIVANDTITGVSTGTGTALGLTTSATADVFRVKTGALPLGLYRHRLTITSSTVGQSGTLRGLDQTGTAGVGGMAGTTDSTIQTSSTLSTPQRFNQWYGFGKQEEIYYRVTGGSATTAAYTARLSTSTVAATVITPAFEATSPITITTIGQTGADTDIHIYDANLNAIAGFDNDDEGPAGTTTQSRLTRTYAPGTYYLAVARSNTAWNFPCPADEDFFSFLMDFPDVVVCSSLTPTTTVDDRDFTITACNGSVAQSNQVVGPDSFSIQWFRFTVANGAPAILALTNDNCASALPLSGSGSHTTNLSTATNDGTASCDPGGAASKDVWYSFNAGAAGGTLSIRTCGTTLDTVVSVHNACGGADTACNDDCGGAPCASTASCLSGIVLAPSQVVLVRVSDKGLGGCGDVTTTFTYVPPPPSNDDCSTPIVLSGPGLYPFNTISATTNPAQGQGLTPACASTSPVQKDLWYTYTANVTGTVTISTCDGLITTGNNDTKISYYNGAGCPAGPSPVGCNDDACLTPMQASEVIIPVTCGQVLTIQVGSRSSTTLVISGNFSVVETGTGCSTPSTPECFGDTAALCPCSGPGGSGIPNPGAAGNGCANSSFPAGAQLTSSGLALDNAGDTLVLTCSNMPGPGLFFQSNGLLGPILNFNDGNLCAASGIIRMGVVFPTAGVASYPGGLTPNPIHIAGAPVLLNGSPTPETKHYQCWYRDITVGFCNTLGHNMSNGLAIVWAP